MDIGTVYPGHGKVFTMSELRESLREDGGAERETIRRRARVVLFPGRRKRRIKKRRSGKKGFHWSIF